MPDPLDGRTTRLALTDLAARLDSPEGRARGRAALDRWVTALATNAPSSSITASRKG